MEYKRLPDGVRRIDPGNMEIVRRSIFLDSRNNPIPMSQVMPKYIPKEPTKGYTSCPIAASDISSRTGSIMLSEQESDACSIHHKLHTDSRLAARSLRKRAKSKTRKRGKVKQRPVNVVGPIVSTLSGSADDREEILSGSGIDSAESDADHARMKEDLIAHGKLVTKLQNDLDSQLKVNAELKKLLVASVGNDLEYRVEKLAQDKAQLSATVGTYSQKLYKDVEDLDRISIQADMWRSKYMASRVQAEEHAQANQSLTQRYSEATFALQQMLEERRTINNNLHLAHRLLKCVHNSASTNVSEASTAVAKTTMQLSDDILAVANDIANSLPSFSSHHFQQRSLLSQTYTDRDIEPFSQSEATAYSVLSEQLIPSSVLEIPHNDDIPRMSSLICQTRASTKKKCGCKNCRSEIIVV